MCCNTWSFYHGLSKVACVQTSPISFIARGKVFWHQSEARTAATVWNWSGKTLSPGALLAVLYFSSCHIFFRPFRLFLVPTICPWVSEDGGHHSLLVVDLPNERGWLFRCYKNSTTCITGKENSDVKLFQQSSFRVGQWYSWCRVRCWWKHISHSSVKEDIPSLILNCRYHYSVGKLYLITLCYCTKKSAIRITWNTPIF